MPDRKFQSNFVAHGYRAIAQRMAVLWPLQKRRATKDAEVVQDVNRLVHRWRQRVLELHEAGWSSLLAKGRVQFVRNCPPQMAVMKDMMGLHTCKLRNICPWCYAKRIAQLYDLFIKYRDAEGVCLVSIKNNHDIGNCDAKSASLLRVFLAQRVGILKTLVRHLRPEGSYYQIVINPYERCNTRDTSDYETGWKIAYRMLAVFPQGWTVPDWFNSNVTKITSDLSGYGIAGAVGRTFRYPTGLLTAPCSLVLSALEASAHKRLCSATGILHQSGREDNS